MAAVPAAIQAVLDAIGGGCKFVIRSDHCEVLHPHPKSVRHRDCYEGRGRHAFVALFTRAITVELENMTQLREHRQLRSIEDIGVAQGNSLSRCWQSFFCMSLI